MIAIKKWQRFLLSKNQFWSRALICWLISCFILTIDSGDNYDRRFKFRGHKNLSRQIVLITIDPKELSLLTNTNKKMYGPESISELYNLSDNHFWDKNLWVKLINEILTKNPQSIGIAFEFNTIFKNEIFTHNQASTLFNKKIIWNAVNNSSQLLFEEDGIIRRIKANESGLENFAEKLTNKKLPSHKLIHTINFKTKAPQSAISLTDFLNHNYTTNLENSIVIIGTLATTTQPLYTPIGTASKTITWANISDNLIEDAFVKKWPFLTYIVLLLLLTIGSVIVITKFPQSLSIFLFIWIATLWSAGSIWLFDTFSIWIPIATPLILLILVWISYIGFHAIKIEEAHEQLLQEQRYFEELEQLKNNFVSLISHDLKTPIAKIQAVVDRQLLQHQNNVETTNDFTKLKAYSEELNRYIQSILKLLRVESRDFKIYKESADINGVVENVIEKLKPLIEEKSIQLELKLDPIFLIEFDVTLITEVILNLVENAIKYTPTNGKIWVHTSEVDDAVIVEVGDTGEGISKEEQDLIWHKFTRGKKQDMKTSGSGLGLYLVKYFVELHNGSVQVKSQDAQGTQFYIRLPIE